jgi:hypothetical protein
MGRLAGSARVNRQAKGIEICIEHRDEVSCIYCIGVLVLGGNDLTCIIPYIIPGIVRH